MTANDPTTRQTHTLTMTLTSEELDTLMDALELAANYTENEACLAGDDVDKAQPIWDVHSRVKHALMDRTVE